MSVQPGKGLSRRGSLYHGIYSLIHRKVHVGQAGLQFVERLAWSKSYCFALLLVQPTESWLRLASAVVGAVLIGLNFVAILVLNKLVPIKIVLVRYGVWLFRLGWAMPLPSLVLAIGFAAAAVCEVAFEVDHASHRSRDWD